MRKCVRAIIIRGDELLVIHRNKFGTEYDTLPGGGIDPGETPEQALYRELAEETGVQITQPRLVYIEDAGSMYGVQYVFLCQYVSGAPQLAADSEEALISQKGQNLYIPTWIKLSELSKVPFVSPGLRDRIAHDCQAGFPARPVQIG